MRSRRNIPCEKDFSRRKDTQPSKGGPGSKLKRVQDPKSPAGALPPPPLLTGSSPAQPGKGPSYIKPTRTSPPIHPRPPGTCRWEMVEIEGVFLSLPESKVAQKRSVPRGPVSKERCAFLLGRGGGTTTISIGEVKIEEIRCQMLLKKDVCRRKRKPFLREVDFLCLCGLSLFCSDESTLRKRLSKEERGGNREFCARRRGRSPAGRPDRRGGAPSFSGGSAWGQIL